MNGLIAIKNRSKSGFNLIELSIVITIVGFLLYITVRMTSGKAEEEKLAVTQERLNRIEQAITVYYQTFGFLPCPAAPSINHDNMNFALEQPSPKTHAGGNRVDDTDVSCGNVDTSGGSDPAAYIGIVPTRNLRLSNDYTYDGYGRRITYAVSRYCVAADNWSAANTYKCADSYPSPITTSGGTLEIADSSGTTWMTDANSKAAYVIVSHGKNGTGAFKYSGKILGDSSLSPAEGNNSKLNETDGTSTAASVLYSDMPISDGNINNAYYDDIVRFRTPLQIDYDATN